MPSKAIPLIWNATGNVGADGAGRVNSGSAVGATVCRRCPIGTCPPMDPPGPCRARRPVPEGVSRCRDGLLPDVLRLVGFVPVAVRAEFGPDRERPAAVGLVAAVVHGHQGAVGGQPPGDRPSDAREALVTSAALPANAAMARSLWSWGRRSGVVGSGRAVGGGCGAGGVACSWGISGCVDLLAAGWVQHAAPTPRGAWTSAQTSRTPAHRPGGLGGCAGWAHQGVADPGLAGRTGEPMLRRAGPAGRSAPRAAAAEVAARWPRGAGASGGRRGAGWPGPRPAPRCRWTPTASAWRSPPGRGGRTRHRVRGALLVRPDGLVAWCGLGPSPDPPPNGGRPPRRCARTGVGAEAASAVRQLP
jgi:hypothetical protein